MKYLWTLVGSLLCSSVGVGADLDWPTYGGNSASQKYSEAAQIDSTNVGALTVAWTWESPDNRIVNEAPALTPWTYKVTPLKVGKQLFVSTSLGHVVALDAATGKEIWQFDTGAHQQGRPTNLGFNHRGVAYWSDGQSARILMPTNDAFLWSLDASTGRPDPAFGENGAIDLTQGLGRAVDREQYAVMAALSIFADVVIAGSSIPTTGVAHRRTTVPAEHGAWRAHFPNPSLPDAACSVCGHAVRPFLLDQSYRWAGRVASAQAPFTAALPRSISIQASTSGPSPMATAFGTG